ncbi:MAG: hypothetical protein OMM_11413 [Candidatus Magnetoglobus multicellularis str. Araruama]|uniref:Core-binding (CB) domain-containing protein n=1 Tax=Candidatus Magnetoglobus multicellularis str. Araruama TaxID=890399 RepID=A0A1V1NYH0_9BACT|nr:MAG: hypothetical protein OMM_11413 [Candidatus Magnetoglobus multicellularis str. Araruama]
MKDDTTGIAKFISDYLYFLIDRKYSSSTIDAYENVLGHFKAFLCGHHVDIHHIADQNILNSFYQTIQLHNS